MKHTHDRIRALVLGACAASMLGWSAQALAQDTTPPKIINASAVSSGADHGFIGLCFDEPLNRAVAADFFNYAPLAPALLTIEDVEVLPDNTSVLLTVSGLTESTFTIAVENLLDEAGNTIVSTNVTSAVLTGVTSVDVGEPLLAGGSLVCGEDKVVIKGTGTAFAPANQDQMHLLYQVVEGDFDKRVRIAAISTTDTNDVWARGGLLARESLDPGARSINVPAGVPTGVNRVEPIVRADGFSGYGRVGRVYGGVDEALPNQWLRLKRNGNNFSIYLGTNGVDWSLIGEHYIPDMSPQLCVGIYASAANASAETLVEFSDFSDTPTDDTTPPVLLSGGTLDKRTVGLKFSEYLDASSVTNVAQYTISQGTITAATLGFSGMSVFLTVDGLTADSFSVTAQGVRDSAGNTMEGSATVQVQASGLMATDIGKFTQLDGTPGTADRPQEGDDPYIIGRTVSVGSGEAEELEIVAGGSNLWNAGDNCHFVYQPVSGDFDVRIEVKRFDRSIGTASYGHGGIHVRPKLYIAGLEYTPDGTKVRNVMNTTYAEGNQERSAIAIWRDDEGGGYGNGPVIGSGTEIGGVIGRWGRLRAGNAKGDPLPMTSPTANRWLRLQRSGDEFISYVSYDGSKWVEHNRHVAALGDTVLVGYALMTDTPGVLTGGINRPAHYSTAVVRYFGVGPARLTIARSNGDIVIQWSGQGYTLQQADHPTGPWNDSTLTVTTSGSLNTVTTAPTSAMQFFRLRK